MGYSKDALKGLSWIGSLSILTKLIGLVEILILAKILLPEQFGAYAVALLTLGFLELVTETGVNVVLLQEEEIDNYISPAWVVSIIRGILISLVLVLAAPFIAGFFKSPDSMVLLYLLSIAPFLRGFINPEIIKFQKELFFKKDFFYRLFIIIIDTSVSVILVFFTKSPVGIAIGFLSGIIVELFLSYLIVYPRPSFKINIEYISKVFHRGKWITGNSILNYLFLNIDSILVGKILGAPSLGVYQLAYSAAVNPLIEFNKVSTHVFFPILTKIKNDRGRLRNAFLKTLLFTLVLSVPVVALLILFPHVLVGILGDKWALTTSVLPILAVLGLIKSISGASTYLFLSTGNQKYVATTMTISVLTIVVTIIPFITILGIVGAGLASLVGVIMSFPFVVFYVIKIFRSNK